MKKFLLSFLVTVVCGVYTQAQTADDTLHKAAIAVCDCLTKANLGTNVTEEQLQQAFLSCVLTSAPDLITQIMASGDDYQKAGEEIGTKLSLELMKTGCPAFTKIAASMALQGDEGISIQTEKPTAVETAEGIVTKVEERDFTYVTLKTTAGRELTFIYYGYVPGSDDWIKDAVTKLKNKNVSVSYAETEVYQPKYKEFMNVKEIKSLTIKK
ncbi:MAG TPA: hypothetical protein VEV83_04805 [Parafilimonas sp.]|nr:hypothetical protein [Parafilimonas sp.]